MKRGSLKFQVYQESGKYPARAFRAGSRLWRWRIVSSNGNILADGAEGYATAGNAKRAVSALISAIGRHLTGAEEGLEIEVVRE